MDPKKLSMNPKKVSMDWDALRDPDDDDDKFFESHHISSGSDDDDDDFEDSRMSFSSTVSSASSAQKFCQFKPANMDDYNMWMEEPGSIMDRRKKLLQGMGLTSKKSFAIVSKKFSRIISFSRKHQEPEKPTTTTTNVSAKDTTADEIRHGFKPKSPRSMLARSQSDSKIELPSELRRRDELIQQVAKEKLTKSCSLTSTSSMNMALSQNANFVRFSPGRVVRKNRRSVMNSATLAQDIFADKPNGTVGEFEKSVRHSPIVGDMISRQNATENGDDSRKITQNNISYFQKSLRASKKRSSAFLKNIKGSMSGLKGDKERGNNSPLTKKNTTNFWQSRKNNSSSSSQWVKARQYSKPFKEFTALHMCQEIQAHEGPIWTLKFSHNARYLASAGEDTVIHIWEVQQSEVASTEISPLPTKKKGKIRNKKKGNSNSIPDYVSVPETVFTLLEFPICSFKGHLDDVLDLSWSKNQLLLSSSMDKTVRLWDMETCSCLKMFAHKDYVTCVQFNPVDDDEFISGSLDSKVRIWSVSNRKVVDWTDLNEMVTAASYTPDGQGAVVGSHKGICRFYATSGGKLEQKDQIELRSRKKKVQPKKVTGIQFSPLNPSEILVTSADSRLRILHGSQLIHKFRGVRNTNSQIMASFTPDGKYVISPSEDSQVYMWRYDDPHGETRKNELQGTTRKTWITTFSHENFFCKDVSVAIPWPGSRDNDPPIVEVNSKRQAKRGKQQSVLSSFQESPNSKRKLPPLPRKNSVLGRTTSCPEEDLSKLSHGESGSDLGESCNSDPSTSNRSYGLSSPSNPSSSRSFFDGTNQGGRTIMQATAWGLALVTAGLGGELRIYQNFGLPFKVSLL